MKNKSKKVNVEQRIPPEYVILWNSIMNYAYWVGESCGEGNSGEFHDPKEAESIDKEMIKAEKRLIKKFSELTGWKPYYVVASKDNNWQEFWDFVPCLKKSNGRS